MDEKNSKEINLLELLKLMFQWFAKVFIKSLKLAGKSLQLLYKYKWLTLVVFVLSLSVALYLSRPSKRIYKAEALAVFHGPEVKTIKEIVKQLENSISNDDRISLATKMGIPDSVSKNIFDIKTFDVIDYLKDGTADKIDFGRNHSLDDTLNLVMNDRLYFQIKTQKISMVPLFQKALTKYISENSLVLGKFNAHINNLNNQVVICDQELKRIDSLEKVVYFKENPDQLKFENNKLLLGENKKQLFYEDLLEVNLRKSFATYNLAESTAPITFPSDFIVIPNPVNGRFKYSVYGLFAALAISLALAFVIDNLKLIFKYLANK